MRSTGYRALATDFDQTLADDGTVAPDVLEGLRRVRASGCRLILVTGRELADLCEIFPGIGVFDRVVAENGGVLYRPGDGDVTVLGEASSPALVDRLRQKQVAPLSVGEVIVATHTPHEQDLADAIRELGLHLHLQFNKGAVMALPRGVTKASGLLVALGELAIASQEVVCIGDAENDEDLFEVCGCGVAVANATPALRERADCVTRAPAGRGVLEIVDWLLTPNLERREGPRRDPPG
jgi:phosphoglycolate phosphatase (TIGR01487 family)